MVQAFCHNHDTHKGVSWFLREEAQVNDIKPTIYEPTMQTIVSTPDSELFTTQPSIEIAPTDSYKNKFEEVSISDEDILFEEAFQAIMDGMKSEEEEEGDILGGKRVSF